MNLDLIDWLELIEVEVSLALVKVAINSLVNSPPPQIGGEGRGLGGFWNEVNFLKF